MNKLVVPVEDSGKNPYKCLKSGQKETRKSSR